MTSTNMKKYMLERYHRRRKEWIDLQGGKCVSCGSINELEIDHIDRTTKKYDIGKIMTSGNKIMLNEELAKCQVLCYACHKKKSDKEKEVEHGGGVSGKKNCPCQPCKSKKSEYSRNYNMPKKYKPL